MSIMFRPRAGVHLGTTGKEVVVFFSDRELWRLDRINLPRWQSLIHVNRGTVGTEVVVVLGDPELPRLDPINLRPWRSIIHPQGIIGARHRLFECVDGGWGRGCFIFVVAVVLFVGVLWQSWH